MDYNRPGDLIHSKLFLKALWKIYLSFNWLACIIFWSYSNTLPHNASRTKEHSAPIPLEYTESAAFQREFDTYNVHLQRILSIKNKRFIFAQVTYNAVQKWLYKQHFPFFVDGILKRLHLWYSCLSDEGNVE